MCAPGFKIGVQLGRRSLNRHKLCFVYCRMHPLHGSLLCKLNIVYRFLNHNVDSLAEFLDACFKRAFLCVIHNNDIRIAWLHVPNVCSIQAVLQFPDAFVGHPSMNKTIFQCTMKISQFDPIASLGA